MSHWLRTTHAHKLIPYSLALIDIKIVGVKPNPISHFPIFSIHGAAVAYDGGPMSYFLSCAWRLYWLHRTHDKIRAAGIRVPTPYGGAHVDYLTASHSLSHITYSIYHCFTIIILINYSPMRCHCCLTKFYSIICLCSFIVLCCAVSVPRSFCLCVVYVG